MNPTVYNQQQQNGTYYSGPSAASQIPAADLASFQKANPGLTFNNQDLAQYNSTPQHTSPTGSITSAQLTPQTALNPQAPKDTPVYPVAALPSTLNPPPLQETAPEAQANSLSDQIQKINDQLTGKSADTSALFSSYGYGTSTDAQGNLTANDPTLLDLGSKLTALTNEAQAIPLQLQQDSTGRGITTGGLQPVQTAALRNNAIQALGVSSLIAAKQGKLAYATQLVNNAIQQKYGPLEEQLKAKTANLDLVLKSPAYSLADKNRAQQQQANLQNQQAALELHKQQALAAQTETLKYAGIANAQQLTEMQQATDPLQVAQIAAKYGLQTLDTQKATTDLSISKYNLANMPLETQLKQAQIASSYASAAASRANAAAFTNPNLIAAVQNGTIDPTKVNSRNAPFMSALANAGVNANMLGIDAAATKKVITNLQVQAAQIKQAGGALESNMKLLATMSDKVNTLGIPKVDTNLNAIKSKYSNQPDVVNYLSLLGTVRSEYAKYIARGSQVDDATNRAAAEAIPAGINGAALNSLYSVIQTEGANVQQSIQEAQKGQWDSLQGTNTAASSGGTSYQSTSGKTYTLPY